MENQYHSQENSSLFSLQIDPLSKSNLYEAARWGKFLAIVGFVMCALIAVSGIFFGTYFSTMYNRTSQFDDSGVTSNMANGMAFTMAFVYIIIAVLYFFACLFLYRFATKMRIALNSNQQDDLNLSFQNLKKLFRYVGILTIIILVIYGLILLIALLSYATTR